MRKALAATLVCAVLGSTSLALAQEPQVYDNVIVSNRPHKQVAAVKPPMQTTTQAAVSESKPKPQAVIKQQSTEKQTPKQSTETEKQKTKPAKEKQAKATKASAAKTDKAQKV